MSVHSSQEMVLSQDNNTVVISVAFPIAIPGLYDYLVPKNLVDAIFPGVPVLVPVRSRKVWGVIIECKSSSNFKDLKEIIDVKKDIWVDSKKTLIELYHWMASYYQCELGRIFRPVISKGIVKSSAKFIIQYVPNGPIPDGLTKLQRTALESIHAQGKALTMADCKAIGVSQSIVGALHKKGCLRQEKAPVVRHSLELSQKIDGQSSVLTPEQMQVVEYIEETRKDPKKPFILFGITGSGKTHVYIELAKRTLQEGKGVILLVPEISLTPQTINRFRIALGDCMSVIHSNMSDGERRDSLELLVTGKKRMVIGVRSAILAPMDNVGLIIVDEEHDGTYKQSDLDPRYNARDVAVMRGKFQHACVVLGSATPSFESYYNGKSGKYNLVKLSSRFGAGVLPTVSIVNMAQEQKSGNWTPFSREFIDKAHACLKNNKQIIILLNRRGYSSVLLCKECGYTAMCPNCSVTLRFHKNDQVIRCHLCNYERVAPSQCPSCKGIKIKYQGTGIQKAEEILRKFFPTTGILRMDQDSTRRKGAHISILSAFASGEAQILLGTQMVAKGLDFPRVSLVGVLQADIGLHLPDFRASERTFQLLAQVAGRAGRQDNLGEVVVQTYFPDNPAVQFASSHDYESFYEAEIALRKELQYPPFGKIVRIVVEGQDERQVISLGARLVQLLRKPNITLLGPAPAPLSRIENEFRYSILLKASQASVLNESVRSMRIQLGKLPSGLRVIVDVDPVNML